MNKQILKFPPNFFWGASTSAHQVEGNNHNDWSEWEKENAGRLVEEARDKWQNWQVKKFPEILKPENYLSGKACDHYNRYEEDFAIAKSLGHNAHRFSIEWSRIEPKEGEFDKKEIEHCRKVIKALRKRGLEPFVTLWHWTMPVWLAEQGGTGSAEFPAYFSRYAERIAKELKDEVKFWITINESTLVNFNAYVAGIWPPQKKCPRLFLKAEKNLSVAHKNAFNIIHKINPGSFVGFAHNIKFIEPKYRFCIFDRLAVLIYKYFSNDRIFKQIEGKYDFIGLNYYFHDKIRFYSGRVPPDNKNKSDMGWEICPEGIYRVLKDVKKYGKPIYITENGLADKQDKNRKKFIEDHLYWIHKAIVEGIDVRGYFYWSLLDNFEWDKGFWPRFGLVGTDYKTMERTVRKSALEYAKICKNNELNHES